MRGLCADVICPKLLSGQSAVRQPEIDVVEYVVELGPELKRHTLVERRVLEQSCVGIEVAGTAQVVLPEFPNVPIALATKSAVLNHSLMSAACDRDVLSTALCKSGDTRSARSAPIALKELSSSLKMVKGNPVCQSAEPVRLQPLARRPPIPVQWSCGSV